MARERGTPASEGEGWHRRDREGCADGREHGEAHLDGRVHAGVVLHVDERPAVMCGDPGPQRQDRRDQREIAPVPS